MHIKFLNHGKGSASKASSYVLGQYDHLGNVRAGVQVLKGDATTFNAICDASPHEHKYTSGVIAWSKEDAPTAEDIEEVLEEFEKHAFAGLDKSQYHLFAVLHTEDDSSKHIHVLVPRLDIQSGKSMNIAPPGHEKHFDSLRDYFNKKKNWSRPDDLGAMLTRFSQNQDLNYVKKLNAQAKKRLKDSNLEDLSKNEFLNLIDSTVKTLIASRQIEKRSDIVQFLTEQDSIKSVKRGSKFLTIILNDGSKHRLKGVHYNEQFETDTYAEYATATAVSRGSDKELRKSIEQATELLNEYRIKRKEYNASRFRVEKSTQHDNSVKSEFNNDFSESNRTRAIGNTNATNELQSANRSTHNRAIEYRYDSDSESNKENRFVFNINHSVKQQHQQSIEINHNQSITATNNHSKSSRASDTEQLQQYSEYDQPSIATASSKGASTGIASRDYIYDFNYFLSNLSNQSESKNNRSAKANDLSKSRFNQQNGAIENADRNRQIFNRTNEFIISTNQFIKEHHSKLSRNREAAAAENIEVKRTERITSRTNISTAIRTIQNATSEFFRRFTDNFEHEFAKASRSIFNRDKLRFNYQEHDKHTISDNENNNRKSAESARKCNITDIKNKYLNRLERENRITEQAYRYSFTKYGGLGEANKSFDRVSKTFEERKIKLRRKVKSAYDLAEYLRCFNSSHKILCDISNYSEQQDKAFQKNDFNTLLKVMSSKYISIDNFFTYTNNRTECTERSILAISKNDERIIKSCVERGLKLKSDDSVLLKIKKYVFKMTERLNEYEEYRNKATDQKEIEHEQMPVLKHKKPNNDFDFGI